MSALLRLLWVSGILAFGFVSIRAASDSTNQAAGFRLMIELQDGSKIIGKNGDDNFQFHSDVLGEMKLPLGRIRSIACQSKTNSVQLATVNGDTLTAQFVTKAVRVETAFGNFKLPVNLIRRLTVSPAGKPGQMREGLVALWPGEGNANDIVGTNNGILENVAFTNGKVGQAFQFNHATSYITVPASPSLDIGSTGSGVTIECWVKPDAFNIMASGPIIEWDSATTDGLQLWTGGSLFANVKDTSGNAHRIETQTVFDVNNFQHVALTYDKGSGLAVLYINGVSVASLNLGSFTPQTTYPVNIGRRTGQPIGLNDTFGGLIDELSLYNRALSAAEIQADYTAGGGN
jgi:Concanavalin A-like lectin/glucanases superfamily